MWRLGVQAVATVNLQNPHLGKAQTVWLDKLPKDKGLTLELEESSVLIPPNGNVNVHLKWCPLGLITISPRCPAAAGNFREVILIKDIWSGKTEACYIVPDKLRRNFATRD